MVFLVELINPCAIAEGILLVYKDSQLRNEISNYNRKCAKNYSWEKIASRLDKIYSSIDLVKADD